MSALALAQIFNLVLSDQAAFGGRASLLQAINAVYDPTTQALRINILGNKLDATTDPGVTNDTSEGYIVGSFWVNVSTDAAFICLDASTGVAVWKDITATAGAGSGDMTKAVYDPGLKNADAFDMDNMSEGATTKILTDTERTKLTGIQSGATVDQTNAEIETAYNAQVGAMSQATAEAGTSTTVERITAQRMAQAIAKLTPVRVIINASDTTTDITAGTAKVTFRMPFAMTLTEVRASVSTAPTGSVLTVDINEGGVSVLSTKLTIDATEKTSTTAATAAVISDSALADDAEMSIDIDGVGSTVAGKELVIYLIGTPA